MIGVKNDERRLVSESGQKSRHCDPLTAISFNQVLLNQLLQLLSNHFTTNLRALLINGAH